MRRPEKAYQDHLGFWTIGVGRLIDKRKRGSGLSNEEIDFLLGNDLKKRAVLLDKKIPWIKKLPRFGPRHRALINMSFQMGVSGLLSFKNTLKLVKAGEYAKAADNALKSKWARKQTPKRAKIVTEMIRTGKDRKL